MPRRNETIRRASGTLVACGATAPEPGGSMSKTLLLADDSVVIQKLVGLSFANEDVEIFSTDNGDDAVTKARELRPDVVLADVVMPGKSGYEVCEAIKKDPALAHIPVLLLTGTFEAFDEARAQAVGATGHITKPFEAQALVERVKTVVKNAVKPAPAREPAPRATPPADDLFDEEPRMPAPATKPSFFGTVESLDVTPSLSEEDLSDSLDLDLFGPPGDVGGPTPRGDAGFDDRALGSIATGGPVGTVIGSFAVADPRRFADAPIEDATVAMIPEPSPPRVATTDGLDDLGGDLGIDDLLEVASLPPASFDLDSAFDPATSSLALDPAPRSASLSSTLGFAHDDANEATSRSFGRPGAVADLDEMLAAPIPSSSPSPIPNMRPTAAGDPPAHAEFHPEAPTILDLGPAEPSGSDLDFGFDVSEQLTVSKVDLLEESFSSLLDVSESQVLGGSPFAADAASSSTPASATPSRAPSPSSEIADGIGDFDVSSSDLATAMPAVAASDLAFPASSPSPNRGTDSFFDDVPPPLPTSGPSTGPSSASASAAAVAHMSPILQQQVQETLEKVAWEAFSDLSEAIVKQVIERVERIAWEVIPQMAETLVREEIRKMKGEED